MSKSKLPNKESIAEQLLRKGSLFIHLDPRSEGVVVPPWLRHQAQLVLQVGYDMPIPIDDLTVDSYGVCGTLSFARTPFRCMIPWNVVFALVGDAGRGMIWEESMPAEILAEVEREGKKSKPNLPWPEPKGKKGKANKSDAKKRQAVPVVTLKDAPRRDGKSYLAERLKARGWKVIEGGNTGGGYDNAS